MIYISILCGGQGSRLWPLSRNSFPKQFISLEQKLSLLQNTLNRIKKLPFESQLLLICNKNYEFLVRANLKSLGMEGTLIVEPFQRNTAPAIALAALEVLKKDPEGIMFVFPSDHMIKDISSFSNCCIDAVNLAQKGYLVTFGIQPNRPETGFGYIIKGAAIDKKGFSISKFLEKPDEKTASSLIINGDAFWNSGMFAFKAKVYLNELQKYSPHIYQQAVSSWQISSSKNDAIFPFELPFKECPEDSIDYSVMEKTDRAVVVPFRGDWNDLGSWNAFYETGAKDANGNVLKGDVVVEDAENNYIHSTSRLVTALGVKDLSIIETKDAVFISPLDRSQEVKKIVKKLNNSGRVETSIPPIVYRPWGSYEGLVKGDRFQVKKILVQPGEELSLQMHHHRAEHWIIVQGSAEVQIGTESQLFTENQSTYIPVGTVHRLKNPGKVPLILIEVQSGSYLGEDDIVRLEDKYDRI